VPLRPQIQPVLVMVEQDIAEATALYAKLAAALTREKNGTAGRRVPPGSRPPLRIEIVSHMADLERFLAWFIAEARRTLGQGR
jgi:hypothetical protein